MIAEATEHVYLKLMELTYKPIKDLPLINLVFSTIIEFHLSIIYKRSFTMPYMANIIFFVFSV